MHKDRQGSIALFFIQLFSTLNYSVLYATLVLFSVQKLQLSAALANNMLATFIAFNFVLHFMGGILGGRLLSFRFLFLIGMCLQTAGSLLLVSQHIHTVYIAMGLFTAGAGLNVPCINCLLTQLFEPEDKNRENAFLWNYSGMNIGFLIGYTIAGYYQLNQHYQSLFVMASFSNIVAIIIVIFHWDLLQDKKTILSENKKQYLYRTISGLMILFFSTILLCFILLHAKFSSEFIMYFGFIIIAFLSIYICMHRDKKEKNKMTAYLVFAVATLIFFTLYQLCPMALTLFLQRNVDRSLMGFRIPTPWFLNIDTVIIIFGCPLFSYGLKKLRTRGYEISMPLLFSLGLLFIGVAILLLPIGIYYSNQQGMTAVGWLMSCYILLSLGELVLSPMGYALVGQLAPPKLRGLLMGGWLMMSGVAATLSAFFSNKALGAKNMISPLLSNASYSNTFLLLGSASVFFGIILFIIRPVLQKLMQ